MDFTWVDLDNIIRTYPGDYAVYGVSGGRLEALYYTPSLPVLSGMTDNEYRGIIERDSADIVLENDRPLIAAVVGRILAGETGETTLTYRILHKVKGFVWVLAKVRVIGETDGRKILMVVFHSSSFGAEEHAELLEHAIATIYVVDKATHELLYCNGTALGVFGHGNYSGRMCYDYISGLAQPCPWCTLPGSGTAQRGKDAFYLPELDKWLRVSCFDLSWFGRAACAVYSVDVSSEKRASFEEYKSRRMYQAAADASGLILWEYDPKTRRISMLMESEYTRKLCAELGIPEVVEGGPEALTAVIDEADREGFLAMYRAIDGGSDRAECDFGFKAGGVQRHEHVICTAIRGEDGETVTVYGTGRDTTAQHLEEEKYARAYRQIAEAHPYALGSFHLNLTKNWCGNGQSPLSFVLEQQKSGTADGYFEAFSNLIADEDVKKEFFQIFAREKLIARFQEGQSSVSIEYPIVYPDGMRYWRKGLLFMLRNPRTGDIEGVTYAVDINDRKRAELIMERMTGGEFDYIGIIHPARRTFEFHSRRPFVTFGAIGEQLDYEKCREYVSANFIDEAELSHFLECTDLDAILAGLRASGRFSASYKRTENGAVSRRHLQYSWLEKPEGDILVVRTDVTAAYEQEQERLRRMRAALASAERANRSKTEFLSRISHDIRTPISIISSMTDFALEDMADPEKLKSDLQKIKSADTFLLSLINDVLDISKIDSGKMELSPEPCLFDEYIANLRNMFEPLCRQKGLTFAVERRRDAGVIAADRIRLNQIALNLLSNAVKYTPPGGTVTYVSDSTSLPDGKIRLALEVRDTGIGMSEEFQKRMFEPFAQEYDNPERPKASTGTGLGLAIVRRISDLMGGELIVESERGKGTCVRFECVLPDADRDPRFAGWRSAGKEEARGTEKLSGRVLLAEDNAVNTEIAVRLLTGFGLEVTCAENGAVAAGLFEKSAPGEFGAVLLDIQMPVMNGYEAAEKIRSLPRPDAASVPILSMTADAFAEAMEHCRAVGMNGHIIKPLDPRQLYDTLRAALGSGDDKT